MSPIMIRISMRVAVLLDPSGGCTLACVSLCAGSSLTLSPRHEGMKIMGMTKEAQNEWIIELLVSRGPAIAYAYMEQNGGLSTFPARLVNIIRVRLVGSISERSHQSHRMNTTASAAGK
jgi:hypothetical protein